MFDFLSCENSFLILVNVLIVVLLKEKAAMKKIYYSGIFTLILVSASSFAQYSNPYSNDSSRALEEAKLAREEASKAREDARQAREEARLYRETQERQRQRDDVDRTSRELRNENQKRMDESWRRP